MSHQLVLLSPYTYPGPYPLTLADEDMAAWLNGYTALWHPALLAEAAEPPRVENPYDHETPRAGTIYLVPESPPNYLPENWRERVQQAGSIAIAATVDRGVTLDNLRAALEADGAPPLGWKEALAASNDMLSLFFGLGFGYLMQGTLAEAMEHENLLERTAFWDAVQKSLTTMASDDSAEPSNPAASRAAEPATADAPAADAPSAPAEDAWLAHLRLAAQKLLTAREVLYPVAIHWLDLHLVSEQALAERWPAAVELGAAANLVASAEALDKLARQQPARFALLKAQVDKDLVEICGGDFHEREDPLLPFDSQLWNLREGLEVNRRLLDKDIRVYARRSFGFHPRTVQLLSSHGVNRMLFLLFDDAAAIPTFNSPIVAFTAPDGKPVDAFVRPPKPANKPETYFNLANTWFRTTRDDHHATVCLLHAGGSELPWHRDLIALSKLAPVLGTWTTFSEYMSQVSAGEYPMSPVADDFHFDFLSQPGQATTPGEPSPARPNEAARLLESPVSRFVNHWKIRRRIDACWTYAALHRALSGAADSLAVGDHLESVERVFETHVGVEPGGLTELEEQTAAALAARLQVKAAANAPGVMLLNPCGFARRYALELDNASAPLPIDGPVKACQLDGSTNRLVVEVPALGFTWLPRSGPPGTATMASRLRMADAKTHTIRNEFFEAEIDPQTGGLRAIRDHKNRVNRLGQRLVFNPGSRPVVTKMEVTSTGPALGEIVTEGQLLGEQNQELAFFRQRFRAWLGRPLLEMRIELTPKQPAAGYPWHAYFGARFAWRDERTHLFRGAGGISYLTTHPRPQSPEFLDLRYGPMSAAIFPNGLPFHQRQESRMVDVILAPEGETMTHFDLGIALDRDQPMLTAWGLASPLALVPTTKGPPHIGASGWLFHLDLPSLLLTKLLPGVRETGASDGIRDAVTAQLLECSGFAAHAEMRCVRNPTRAVLLNGAGQYGMTCPVQDDVVTIDVAPHDWVQLQVEFS